MSNFLKKTLAIILLATVLMTGYTYAYTVKQENKMSFSQIKKLLGDKIAALDLSVVSSKNGMVFLPVRDNKTRRLEWFLLNPFTKRIQKNGQFPFRVYTQVAISTDQSNVMAFSRYPTAIWQMSLKDGSWNKVYENPKKEGLALLSISPLSFINSNTAFSIMDTWDEKHFTTDTVLTAIKSNPFSLDKIVSSNELMKMAVAKIKKDGLKVKPIFKIDSIAPSEGNNIAFILRAQLSNNKQLFDYKDYLFTYSPSDKVNLVDEVEGRIGVLDYTGNGKILYRAFTRTKVSIYYSDGKTKKLVSNKKALAGRIMSNGTVGIVAVDGRKLVIHMGEPDGTLQEILTLRKPYKVGIMEDGSKLILLNNDEIITYRISK